MDVGVEWLGVAPTHVHMHVHARMHTHTHACVVKHDNFMQMAAPIGFGEIPGISYDVITCVCMACPHV